MADCLAEFDNGRSSQQINAPESKMLTNVSHGFPVKAITSLVFAAMTMSCIASDIDLAPDTELFGSAELQAYRAYATAQDSEKATVRQDGNANALAAAQYGSRNTLAAVQVGVGNQASLMQVGSDNLIAMNQSGLANVAQLAQGGVGNSAQVTQNGNNNLAQVLQLGYGLSVVVTQSGSGNVAKVTQRN